MFENYILEPLNTKHIEPFLEFSDKYIGKNYFNKDNFETQIKLSHLNSLNSSFVILTSDLQFIGLRITYSPGLWQNYINTQFLGQLKIPNHKVGYFKSLFIHPDYQGKNIGPYLSNSSLNVLKEMGCTHVVSHSWLESPNNSSVKYLERYGFKQLGVIKNFWKDVDYLCSGCNLTNCQCTAVEMILEIK